MWKHNWKENTGNILVMLPMGIAEGFFKKGSPEIFSEIYSQPHLTMIGEIDYKLCNSVLTKHE